MINRDQVWRNLLEYIDSQELFFPDQVRAQLNPAAEEIFEEFLQKMLRHKLLIPFGRKNLAYRIAHAFYRLKTKLFSKDKKIEEVLVKGPGWQEPGGQSLDELFGGDSEKA